MTDTQKVALLHELDEAATHATKVVNGIVRGSERVAYKRLAQVYDRIAIDWIGRKLTPEEMNK